MSQFTDSRDGKTYKTVKIGGQTWMAENLDYDVADSKCYDNDPANCTKYGRLYNWETAKIACPSGWHLPSDAEWTTLTNFVGTNAGTKLKSSSGWESSRRGAPQGTDDFGFSALPGGYGSSDGYLFYAGDLGYWWSATDGGASSAWNRYMDGHYEYVGRGNDSKAVLFSVRCVQD